MGEKIGLKYTEGIWKLCAEKDIEIQKGTDYGGVETTE
jgi:hypothetical protein